MAIALMLEGESDVNLWYETYGFTFPVLGDLSQAGSSAIGLQGGIPHHALIGRDMTMRVFMNQPSDSDIQAALDEEWPEVDYAVPPDLGGGGDDDDEVPENDQELDGSGLGASDNPFLDASRSSWNGQVVCAVGSESSPAWLAALALIPLLAWRRR